MRAPDMETLRLLPQVFYDLISRVIPGVIGLVLISYALERDLGGLISGPFAGAPALQTSPLFLGIATVGASYIMGQITAPISDLYERHLVSRIVPAGYWTFPAAMQPESAHTDAFRAFLRRELELQHPDAALAARRFNAMLFVWYDWLRVWKPEAGMRVTKLRAEYRMFGGIAVSALFAVALHLVLGLFGRAQLIPAFGGIALLVTAFASWGMVRTYRTFQWSVVNQYYVGKRGDAEHGAAAGDSQLAAAI
jgi:hypothetical protein